MSSGTWNCCKFAWVCRRWQGQELPRASDFPPHSLELLPLSLFAVLGPLSISPPCFPNPSSLCLGTTLTSLRIIFTMAHILFFFKALGFRGLIGKEKVSVLAHLEFTLQLFVSFVDSNTGSEALFAFLLVFQESFWGAVFGILFCTPCSTTFPPLFSSKYVQFTRRC